MASDRMLDDDLQEMRRQGERRSEDPCLSTSPGAPASTSGEEGGTSRGNSSSRL